MIEFIEEKREKKYWNVKAMETKGPTLYRSFQDRPDMTIYDSKIYDDIHEAIERCQTLNKEKASVAVYQGKFPVSK